MQALMMINPSHSRTSSSEKKESNKTSKKCKSSALLISLATSTLTSIPNAPLRNPPFTNRLLLLCRHLDPLGALPGTLIYYLVSRRFTVSLFNFIFFVVLRLVINSECLEIWRSTCRFKLYYIIFQKVFF